jgi:hypothetical protein
MRRLILLSLATFVIGLATKAFANQGQAVMPQLVENELRKYIIQRFGWKTEKFELRVVGLPTVSLPIGPLQLRVLRAPPSLAPGQQIFQGKSLARKRQILTVRSEIKTFEDVVVAFLPLAFQKWSAPKRCA